MISVFSIPKPFKDQIAIIQRNAIQSWLLLHSDCEVVLCGDDYGTRETALELGTHYIPGILRNSYGTPLLNSAFEQVEGIARHPLLCYVNADIIFAGDLVAAVQSIPFPEFLMVGRRWDTPITQLVNYSDAGWNDLVSTAALSANEQRDWWWIDYFVFSRGFFGNEMPPFVIGTVRWDNWLLWKALDLRLPVVDASQAVLAVHQNHDYNYHPDGKKGVWEGKESQQNLELAGGWDHIRNIFHATRQITADGRIAGTWMRRKRLEMKEFAENPMSNTWYSLLRLSLTARRALGLNRQGIAQIRTRFGAGGNLK